MEQLLSNLQLPVIVVALFSAGVIAAGATSPVDVCQVVGRSGEFDNQLVSLRGVLGTSEEGGWLLPASPCPNPVVDGKTMHNAVLVWTGKTSPKLFKYRVPLNTDDESLRALWNHEHVCQQKRKGLLVVLHGRFEGYPFFKIASKGKVVNYGFGSDLNFTGQIVADRAEKIFGCVEEPHRAPKKPVEIAAGARAGAVAGMAVCQGDNQIATPAGEWDEIAWVHGVEVALWRAMDSDLALTRDGGSTWDLIHGPAGARSGVLAFSGTDAAWLRTSGELWRLERHQHRWTKVTSATPVTNGVTQTLALAPDGTEAWIGGSVYREATEKEATSLERRFWRRDAPGKFEVLKAALYRTNDGGASWEEVRLPVSGALEVSDLHFAEGRLIAATDRGLFESTNGGGAWRAILPLGACVSLRFRVDFSGRYFIATGGGGIRGSPSWMLFTNQASSYLLAGAANQDHLCEVDYGQGAGEVEKVVAIPNGLITKDREGRVTRSEDLGSHWENVPTSERVIDIEATPEGRVLVLTDRGLRCMPSHTTPQPVGRH